MIYDIYDEGGTVDQPIAWLSAGDSIMRKIANLGDDWSEIGIGVLWRVTGPTTLASAAVAQDMSGTPGSTTRFWMGLKNSDNQAIPGTAGCIAIGATNRSDMGPWLTLGGGSNRVARITSTVGGGYNPTYWLGLSYGTVNLNKWGEVNYGPQARASAGTEETTNAVGLTCFKLKIADRGTANQTVQMAVMSDVPATSYAFTKAYLQDKITTVTYRAYYSLAAPVATYNLDGKSLDAFYLRWPYSASNLALFNLVVMKLS